MNLIDYLIREHFINHLTDMFITGYFYTSIAFLVYCSASMIHINTSNFKLKPDVNYEQGY